MSPCLYKQGAGVQRALLAFHLLLRSPKTSTQTARANPLPDGPHVLHTAPRNQQPLLIQLAPVGTLAVTVMGQGPQVPLLSQHSLRLPTLPAPWLLPSTPDLLVLTLAALVYLVMPIR